MIEFELDASTPAYLSIIVKKGVLPKDLIALNLKKIEWNHSIEVLKQLAGLGIFFWQQKRLVLDLFSSVPLEISVTKQSNGIFQLDGTLLAKTKLSLKDCQWISPSTPPWYIFNQTLKIIRTPLNGTFLQRLPRTTDYEEVKELQTDLQEQLVVENLDALKKEPLPLLYLTDKKGAFANLMMDYGSGTIYVFASHEGKKQRHHPVENQWEKDLLETAFVRKLTEGSTYYCPLDKVGKSLAFLLEIGWKIYDANKRQIILESKKNIHLQEDESYISISGSLNFEGFEADLKKVLGTFNRRESFVELNSSTVGLLKFDEAFDALLEEIELIQDKPMIRKEKIGLLESTSAWSLPPELNALIEEPTISVVPSVSFKGFLRPYQGQGLTWINNLYQKHLNGVLGDEMGLGKTVQVLAFLSLIDPKKRFLVVVPSSLIFNWSHEIKRFYPSLPYHIHHGKDRFKTQSEVPTEGLILTSYHTLRVDVDFFKKIDWECIILDEAQVVKNASSQAAQALYQLKSRFRLAMSGTLIENHPKELWAHFHFLMPRMLGELDAFEQILRLSEFDKRYSRKIQKMLSPFILRRKKEQVVKDLPPLDEQVTFVEMTPEQRELYDSFLASSKQGLIKKSSLENPKNQRLHVFEILLRLRQIACHPLLVTQLMTKPFNSSGKMEALRLDIETIREEGKKALIFSQFASMLHIIGKELEDLKIPYCLLEGETRNREEVVTRFQNDPDTPFFLITLKAGGVGLNLTAADYVLIYDPWWHNAAEAQAISRAHRIGQNKPVIAKRYITIESVEEKLLSLKKSKSDLFSELTDEDFTNSNLTMDDLYNLI